MDHLPISIKCPNCASALNEDDFDEAKGLMKCGYCRTLLLPPKARTGPQGFRLRPPIPLPAGMSLEKTTDGIVITRLWRNLPLGGLLLFISVYLLIIGLNEKAEWSGQNLTSMIFHVGVLALGYYALALLINKTRIQVTHGSINVSHGPLPWLGWREIAAGMVEQLYCKETIVRTNNGPSLSYETWILLSDGSNSKLVGSGLEVEQALYIEQQIESILNLKDKPIAGEFRR